MANERVTLRAEIADILQGGGNEWMTPDAIVAAIKNRGRFHKEGGREVTTSLFCRHTRNFPNIFEREGTSARLRATERDDLTEGE